MQLLTFPILWALAVVQRVDAQFLRLSTNYLGDAEASMTVPQIIRRWDYPVEIHQVETADGYIVTLHRIPHGRHETPTAATSPKRVVFLQHGLLCTSSVWLMNLPHQSPGFIFADAGSDVWMANSNSYSRSHKNPRINRNDYWKFSWAEMARYDLEAMVDYVLNKTGQPNLYYVGHSQGTLTMFAKLSLGDDFSKKIKRFFAIAPVASVAHIRGLFRYMTERSYEQLLTMLTRWLTEFICGLATTNPLCENFLFLVSGPDSNQLNKTRIGVYLAHNPAGTSLRNIIHFLQMVRHKQLLGFDNGKTGNMEAYNMLYPPTYDLTRIVDVPIHLYYSDADWLATSADVEGFLLKNLPSHLVVEKRKLLSFNHNDWLFGLRAPDGVYRPIVDAMLADEPKVASAFDTPLVTFGVRGSPPNKSEDSDLLVSRNVFKIADTLTTPRPSEDADLIPPRPEDGDLLSSTPSHLRAAPEHMHRQST